MFAAVSLIGIVATQVFWVRSAFNLQEKQFNERVIVALGEVANEILTIQKDESELYKPVKQVSSNYFIATINDTVHPYLLENLLKIEFAQRNIKVDFEYVVYDCFTDSIVFGDYITLNKSEKNILHSKSQNLKWDKDGHYFGVYFPTKSAYIISEMGIWLFSSSIIIIIIIFFAYTISIILKQKRLSEIKNDFINNMTHEFKTPISTISLSADVLLTSNIVNDPDRLRSYAKIIKEENKRLKNQVDKVLQLATLDKDKLKLENETLNIHDLIDETIKSYKLILEKREGEITVNNNAKNAELIGDKIHILNILHNIIDNAIKYSPQKPKIEISTANIKWFIKIVISDNGIGISRDEQKQVFEKFYRVPTGNVHDVKGFGLGLNYVKTIVEAYKGKVKLKSKEGQGSTFIIYLPTVNEYE